MNLIFKNFFLLIFTLIQYGLASNDREERHDRDKDRLTTLVPTPSPSISNQPSTYPSPQPSLSFIPSRGPICRETNFDELTGDGLVERTRLRKTNLLGTENFIFSNPVHMKWFTMPDNAAHPKHNFCGTLSLEKIVLQMKNDIVVDDKFYSLTWKRMQIPEFSQSFVQHGSHLLPTESGLKEVDHPYYEILVGAGRVWSEIGDIVETEEKNYDDDRLGFDDDDEYEKFKKKKDSDMSAVTWSRASFPFTLVERNNDCTHNGVMTFLYNDESVSNLAYEIVQETCVHFKANLWGMMKAYYSSNTLPPESNSREIQNDFENHLSNRIPVKPISELEDMHGTDFSSFDEGNDATMYSFYVDGISYIGGFETRSGKYPYPGTFTM